MEAHCFLASIRTMAADNLDGIAEADETYVLEYIKGDIENAQNVKKTQRKTHKRGKSKERCLYLQPVKKLRTLLMDFEKTLLS